MSKRIYTIDGTAFDDMEGFFRHFGAIVLNGYTPPNLDAFNDVLRGGFGTQNEGFILHWIASDLSRTKLGFRATANYYNEKILSGYPHQNRLIELLHDARMERGETLFDLIVEVIKDHSVGGLESQDGIELILL